MKKVNHWINGKNVAGNDYFQTTNPATGEVLADVASADERACAPDAPSGRSDRPERA